MNRSLLIIPGGIAGLLVAAIITFSGISGSSAAGPAAYTFDGQPSAPGPFTQLNQAQFDVQEHSRSPETWYGMETMQAQHGPSCEGPTVSHTISSWDDAVFKCKDHLMTAINATDYGVIYVTPNAMVDFSGGAGVVQFEMSTNRMSVRDWPDIWISPYAQNRALPLDTGLPDLQGPPPNAIHVAFNTTEFAPILTVIKNGVEDKRGNGWEFPSASGNITAGTNQSATRQTFRLTIEAGKVTFERLASPTATYIKFWSHSIPDLGFRQGVVQFGHHSYNPKKDDSGLPGTWHWDNINISPSVPLTFVKADRRYLDGKGGTITFAQGAPKNAYLRFAAIGRVTVDGKLVQPLDNVGHPEHFSSYFVPIAEGTKQVAIGLTGVAYPGFARDFAVWSQGTASGGGTVIATPTTAAPTAPATSTPSPTATAPSATVPPATSTTTTTTTATPPPAGTPAPSAPGAAAGSRIQWGGKNWYLFGANLPWFNWAADFGGGTNSGVSGAVSRTAIGNKLGEASAAGLRNIRWWMFPGDAWQITRDASGKPTGINPEVYKDIDAALALAAEKDVYLTFVFFSAPSHIPQSWLTNPSHQQALADVLGSLAARYKTNNRIVSWEIMNEPEWDIWNGKVSQVSVQNLVRTVATSLNAASPAHVTVGAAMLDGLPLWKGLGLDYYQVHWYDYMASGQWCARCTDYATVRDRYGLDAPLVIGEMYAAPGSGALSRFDDMYAKGYAGAWVWSLFSERTSDRMAVDMAAAKSFADKHTDDGPTGVAGSGSSPTASPTSSRTATATPSRTATATATPSKTATPAATATKTATATPTATQGQQPNGSRPTGTRGRVLTVLNQVQLLPWQNTASPQSRRLTFAVDHAPAVFLAAGSDYALVCDSAPVSPPL